jgi:tetratricopeptide (TPR) repeat protein
MNHAFRALLAALAIASAIGGRWVALDRRADLVARGFPETARAYPAPNPTTTYSDARLFIEAVDRSLRITRIDPDIWVRRAGYAYVLDEREEALEALRAGRQFAQGMVAMTLEAGALRDMKRIEEATAAYERLHRLAPADRAVLQNLIKLHQDRGERRTVGRLAAEAEMRRPGTFDTLIGMGQGYIPDDDYELILKYYFLAFNLPGAEVDHPEPRIFKREVMRKIVDDYLRGSGR